MIPSCVYILDRQQGRNRSAARVWQADFGCEHPAQISRSDPLTPDISTKPRPFRALIGALRVLRLPRCCWEMATFARAKITPQLEAEKPIANVSILDSLISRQSHILFGRGLVRRGPLRVCLAAWETSLCLTSLRSRFWIRASAPVQQDHPSSI